MKLCKSERNEIIKLLKKVLYNRKNIAFYESYLCHNINEVLNQPIKNRSGLVLEYFLSQRPTSRMNKKFYHKSHIILDNSWWDMDNEDIRNKFLEHLIKKLTK